MKQSSELAPEAKDPPRGKRNLRRRRIPKRIPPEDALDVQSRTQMRPKEIELLYARQGFRRVAPYGLMGFSEFCSMLGVLAMLEETQIADRLFSAFDRDHNKQLTFREFAVALGTMMCGREEEKLDLGFRILNPSFTGTGASLSDYEFDSPDEESFSDGWPAAAKTTDAAGDLPRSGRSVEAAADGGEAPLQQPHQQQQEQQQEEQQQQERDEVYESHHTHKARVSLAAFNKLKSTVYADSVPASAFVSLVRAMEASRKILLGDDGPPLATQEIERVFLPLSTLLPDGTRRMFERDYKHAVRNSPSFIALLGVDVGGAAADTSTGSQAAKAWDETTEAERMTTEGIVKNMQDVTSRMFKAVSRRSSGAPSERRSKGCQNQQLLLQLQQCMHNLQDLEKQLEALKALPPCPVSASRAAAEAAAAAAAAATAVELSRDDRQETWSSPLAGESDASVDGANTEAAAPAPAAAAAPDTAPAAAAADTAKAAAVEGKAAAEGTTAAIPTVASAEAAALATSAAAAAAAEAAAAEAAAAAAASDAATTAALSLLRDTELQMLQLLEAAKVEADQEPLSPISASRTGDSSKGGDAKLPLAAVAAVAAASHLERERCLETPWGRSRGVTAQELAAACAPTHIAAAASAAAASASAAAARATAPSATAPSAAADSSAVAFSGGTKILIAASAAAATTLLGLYPIHLQPFQEAPLLPSSSCCCCCRCSCTKAAFEYIRSQQRRKHWHCIQQQPQHFAPVFCLSTGFRDRRSMANPDNEPDDPRAAVEPLQKGAAIYFGHQSWNTAINVMLGMRIAGGRTAIAPERSLKPYDFDLKEKFSLTHSSPRDSNYLNSATVRFTDYAPMAFRRLRELFKIDKTVYIHSIGPEQVISNLLLGSLASLSELVSEGKSGALFYYTADGKFIIKTVSRDAAQGLRNLLPDYFEHFTRNSESLITRFLGLHAIQHTVPCKGKIGAAANGVKRKIYFLVMENLFHTPVPIHRRYDLKGSTYKRSLAPEFRQDSTIALKDNDLEMEGEKIDVGPERASKLMSVLRADAEFLKAHGLMDYSLLVGIYYAPKGMRAEASTASLSVCGSDPDASKGTDYKSDSQRRGDSAQPRYCPPLLSTSTQLSAASDPGPEEPFWKRDLGGLASHDGTKLFYLGIIDILTKWGAFKRTEHAARVIQPLCAVFRETHRLAAMLGGSMSVSGSSASAAVAAAALTGAAAGPLSLLPRWQQQLCLDASETINDLGRRETDTGMAVQALVYRHRKQLYSFNLTSRPFRRSSSSSSSSNSSSSSSSSSSRSLLRAAKVSPLQQLEVPHVEQHKALSKPSDN
ncbi:hypothetical protein Emed_003483 [Eimeria media]